jgi:hypothetical protein
VNVAPSDPADQCLHNRIDWANRYDARIAVGFSPLQKAFIAGLSLEPTLTLFGGRLEAVVSPENKTGGGRATALFNVPLNDKMALQVPLSGGLSVDSSGSQPWFTLEGGAGLNFNWTPNRYVRFSLGSEFQMRYRWAPSKDKWDKDVALAEKEGKALAAQIESRVDEFGADVDAQLALLSADARAVLEAALASYLDTLRDNALAMGVAALTPGGADDAAALSALENAASAVQNQLDSQLGGEISDFKNYLSRRVGLLVSDVKNDLDNSWTEFKEGFVLPFDEGGGANIKIKGRVDLQYPLIESAQKDGGGIWLTGGIGVTGNIPVPIGGLVDKRLLVTDMDPASAGVRFDPSLGFRFQVPNSTFGGDIVGTWSPTVSGDGFEYKNAAIMARPSFHF